MDSFGKNALRHAVLRAVARKGESWLTDGQMEEIVSSQVSDWRWATRINRANKHLVKAAKP